MENSQAAASALPIGGPTGRSADVAPAAWAVPVGLLLFAVVWLTYLAFSGLTPPRDNIEQLVWVGSLEWGYYKHPPLPTWLLWLPVQVLGRNVSTVYITGACVTLAALGLYWRLLIRLRGPGYAFVALLAALCITYYNERLDYYNHNIVLLLASTACAALTWQAFATRRLRWWFALGLAVGLGALAKYQIAVTIASILVFAAHQKAWRDPRHRLGLWVAALVALLVFTPHLEWLRTHDFGPIGYAMTSSLGAKLSAGTRTTVSFGWLAHQVLERALPGLLLLALVARIGRRPVPVESADGPPSPGCDDAAVRALLLAWGLVPLLFMTSVGVAFGVNLKGHWGTPFLLFVMPAAMELTPSAGWGRIRPQQAVLAFVFMQLMILASSGLQPPGDPAGDRVRDWRAFDSPALARQLGEPARRLLQGPIRVVIGNTSVAGALALQLEEHPVVLIDRRFDQSPWVSRDLLRRCGALEIGDAQAVPSGQPVGSGFPKLYWQVVRPEASADGCPSP